MGGRIGQVHVALDDRAVQLEVTFRPDAGAYAARARKSGLTDRSAHFDLDVERLDRGLAGQGRGDDRTWIVGVDG